MVGKETLPMDMDLSEKNPKVENSRLAPLRSGANGAGPVAQESGVQAPVFFGGPVFLCWRAAGVWPF